MGKAIRVALVDDHHLFRAGIRCLLQAIPGVEVVAEAADGRQALTLIEHHLPRIVLMDLLMPGLNGLEATARVVKKFPGVRVIILSMNSGEDSVLQTLRAGAAGYLVKSANPAELELAIRAVDRGETFLSSAISKLVVDRCVQRIGGERSSLEHLTSRQREVLQLIAEGYSTKGIAQELGIGLRTAETYRTDLMKVLGIHDVASLTRYAICMGLISADQ